MFFLSLAATAAAQAPPPAQKALLLGYWADPENPTDCFRITAKDVSSHSCGGTDLGGTRISTKPDGSWYVLDKDGECSVVVLVTAKRLEMSPVGGRGNTLVYKRCPASARKK